jgi:pyruvate dehydrogenase E2 component (dihydrolipoamide acetyltransferase)
VETDKINNEVEASAAGRIVALVAEAGSTVEVGATIALWTGTDQVRSTLDYAAPPPPSRVLSTPLARRLAAQGAMAIGDVPGTGPRGRIQARDVRAMLDRRPVPPVDLPSAPRAPRDHRALIAARVSRSFTEIPHFYVTADAVFDPLSSLRDDLNADPEGPGKLSVTAFITAAIGRALTRVPGANVVWRDGRVAELATVAVGVAVETTAGVAAPVVPVGGDGLYALARRLDAAIERARAGRLRTEDAGEAAIGVSNVGMHAVRALAPVIDPDQSFMLGVGAPRSVFRPGPDGAPKFVRELTLTLACDHRAIDGAAAARLLGEIVAGIEHPARLLTARG